MNTVKTLSKILKLYLVISIGLIAPYKSYAEDTSCPEPLPMNISIGGACSSCAEFADMLSELESSTEIKDPAVALTSLTALIGLGMATLGLGSDCQKHCNPTIANNGACSSNLINLGCGDVGNGPQLQYLCVCTPVGASDADVFAAVRAWFNLTHSYFSPYLKAEGPLSCTTNLNETTLASRLCSPPIKVAASPTPKPTVSPTPKPSPTPTPKASPTPKPSPTPTPKL